MPDVNARSTLPCQGPRRPRAPHSNAELAGPRTHRAVFTSLPVAPQRHASISSMLHYVKRYKRVVWLRASCTGIAQGSRQLFTLWSAHRSACHKPSSCSLPSPLRHIHRPHVACHFRRLPPAPSGARDNARDALCDAGGGPRWTKVVVSRDDRHVTHWPKWTRYARPRLHGGRRWTDGPLYPCVA